MSPEAGNSIWSPRSIENVYLPPSICNDRIVAKCMPIVRLALIRTLRPEGQVGITNIIEGNQRKVPESLKMLEFPEHNGEKKQPENEGGVAKAFVHGIVSHF